MSPWLPACALILALWGVMEAAGVLGSIPHTVEPPTAFRPYCATYPDQCEASEPATITDARLGLVAGINAEWNHEILWPADWLAHGRDAWRIGVAGDRGVCVEFAVTKRAALVRAGVPEGALALALVHVPGRVENHLVLLARAESGVYVLDARSDYIWPQGAVHYRWIARQEWGEPTKWLTM